MKNFSCPSCGAGLSPSVQRFLTCPYCGSTVCNDCFDPEAEKNGISFLGEKCIQTLIAFLPRSGAEEIDEVTFGNPLPLSRNVKRAKKSFGIPEEEKVYLIYDTSLLGNCKAGFAFCTQGLYFKDDETGVGFFPWEDYLSKEIRWHDGSLFIGEAEFICGDDSDAEIGGILKKLNDAIKNP